MSSFCTWDKALIFHNATTLEAHITLTVFGDNFLLDGLPNQSDLVYKFNYTLRIYFPYCIGLIRKIFHS